MKLGKLRKDTKKSISLLGKHKITTNADMDVIMEELKHKVAATVQRQEKRRQRINTNKTL